jgi:hypothetical protein
MGLVVLIIVILLLFGGLRLWRLSRRLLRRQCGLGADRRLILLLLIIILAVIFGGVRRTITPTGKLSCPKQLASSPRLLRAPLVRISYPSRLAIAGLGLALPTASLLRTS